MAKKITHDILLTSTMDVLAIPVKAVHLKALPDNADYIWFSIDGRAREGQCYPLGPGDSVSFRHGASLDLIEFYFATSTDKLVILYETEEEGVRLLP